MESRALKRRLILVAVCSIGWLAVLATQPAGFDPAKLPETNPRTSDVDLMIGGKLYEGRCAPCHGRVGEGGRGSALHTGRFRRGDSDRDLFLIIRNGVPGSDMLGSPNLSKADIWRLVAHVRSLGRRGGPDEVVPGDPARGAAVYERNDCAACHTIGGRGGVVGPDLTDIGSKRGVRYLRESVVDPSADVPPDYQSVAVTTRAGQSLSGIRLNEDEYSIHLQDPDGELRSFLKSDLARVTRPSTSLMPRYDALAATELDDLIAFLSSLQPKRAVGAALAP